MNTEQALEQTDETGTLVADAGYHSELSTLLGVDPVSSDTDGADDSDDTDTGELIPGSDDTGELIPVADEMPTAQELHDLGKARAEAATSKLNNSASESAQKIAAQREQAKSEKLAKAAAAKAEREAKAAADKAEKATKAAAAKAERDAKAAAAKAERDAKAAAAKAEREAKAAAAKAEREAKAAADAAEKEAKAAAEKEALAAADDVAPKQLRDDHVSLMADSLCPYCASGDVTFDDEQGAPDEGKYYYCHACDTSYSCADGSLRSKPVVVVAHTTDPIRSVAASQSWDDLAVREARSQRNGCKVEGATEDGTALEYPSVYKAFLALSLPVAKHQKFRKELKAARTKKFGELTFTII